MPSSEPSARRTNAWTRSGASPIACGSAWRTTARPRLAAARQVLETAKYPFPLVVDRMDDAACKGYGAWPERLYAIAQDGTVAYQGGQGPRDVHLSRSIPTYTWEGAPDIELSQPLDEFLDGYAG